ncbi:MAG: hypothetical protein Q8K96_08405 [Rubrivivax sp.]|nr:hypothetical protein [Rubrivivax sp.]
MSSARDNPPRQDAHRGFSPTELLAPRTQIVADREAYLGQGTHDVGRRISDDQVELFISADVASSLQQEFSLHTPEFVALHDVGPSASLRLLSSLASAASARVQRLSVRRQGHGVALAVIQFVEVPLADGTPVRVYSTDINADAATRAHVASVLLAFSRLGVLLIGELPSNALAGQLAPLQESLRRGPWPNRDLLLVPLGTTSTLATQAIELGGQSAVAVHVTPRASRPKQAWAFISGSWNRLHGMPNGERALPTEMALAVPRPSVPEPEAATQPMELGPAQAGAPRAPPAPQPTLPMPMPVPGGTNWQTYANHCALIKGAISCCVFDMHSAEPLAHAGGTPRGDRLAEQGVALLAQVNTAARALGLGAGKAEAGISTASHHLLLREVPGHPGVAVHLVVSAGTGNLMLARLQLERVEPPK